MIKEKIQKEEAILPISKEDEKFLQESNAIENVRSDAALIAAIDAWRFIRKFKGDTITVPLLLETHRLIMDGLNPIIAGKFRECSVYIGNRHCVFTSATNLRSQIQIWLDMMNEITLENYTQEQTGGFIRAHHVHFEFIHPFEDGNGRVGRIFYNLHRLRIGLPIHTIYEDKKMRYYAWFN